MTGLQVVQRTLDFWDPLGASVFCGGSINQFDEYYSYAFAIHDMLVGGTTEADLRQYLDLVRFQKIGLRRDERSLAENRFYAWALVQTWARHQEADSNIRVREDVAEETRSNWRFAVGQLEMVQQFLQDWDPLDLAEVWLCGADLLHTYDEAAVGVLELLRARAPLEQISEALTLIAYFEGEKIAFCLENRKLSSAIKEEMFQRKVKEDAREKLGIAKALVVAFAMKCD